MDFIKTFLGTRGAQILARWIGMVFLSPSLVSALQKVGVVLTPDWQAQTSTLVATGIVGLVLLAIDHWSHKEQAKGLDCTSHTSSVNLNCLLLLALPALFLTGCKPSVQANYNPGTGNIGLSVMIKQMGSDVQKAVSVTHKEKGL